MEIKTEDERPVLIVMDGRYLVHVGAPETFNKKLIAKYVQQGYKIQTITIKMFRDKKWKWYWEKPKTRQSKSN